MKLRMISVLFCVLLLLTCGAQADTAVTFENMHYGDEAFQMHLNNEINKLIFQGEEYLLEDDCFSFREAMVVWGGKTRAVYEMTLPHGKFSVAPNGEELLIGTVEIDIPKKATLYVGSGNRRSGEYTLEDPITLTDVYREEITLPRSEQGAPLLIDRVYLYSYEVNGETRRFAATLYIDYDNYTASYAGTDPVQADAPTFTQAPSTVEAAAEAVSTAPSAAAKFLPFAVIVLAAGFILIRRKKPAAKLPAASEETTPFAEKAEELLRQIEEEGSAITDADISAKVTSLLDLCRKIIKAAAEQPAKASQCRRFLSYYLPTTHKMLASFRKISESGVSGADVEKVRQSTGKGMDMILEACQKLLDNLYKGDVMDTSVDVEILEKMLKQDGLIENELDISRIIPVDEE